MGSLSNWCDAGKDPDTDSDISKTILPPPPGPKPLLIHWKAISMEDWAQGLLGLHQHDGDVRTLCHTLVSQIENLEEFTTTSAGTLLAHLVRKLYV